MWNIQGKPIDPKRFKPFEPLRVLNFYDGPRIFTFQDADESLCLANWSDEGDKIDRFIVVPTSERIISDLENGLLSVREALAQPRTWVVDLSFDGELLSAWIVAPEHIPEDAQPQPRTMLHRSLDPLLSLKAIGTGIRPGEIPGSVIKGTVEGAQKAIKCLAEYEMDQPARRGRPSRTLTKLYDLPAQKLIAASFEVQFRSPLLEPNMFDGLAPNEAQDEREVLKRVGEHLKAGLAWLTSTKADTAAVPVPNDPELSRVIVKAMKLLTPSPRGPVRELEIRGELVAQMTTPIRLTHNSRAVVNSAIARLPVIRETIVRLEGFVRELDADRMSFILRDLANDNDKGRECRFDFELWDRVYDLLGVDSRVAVAGTETSPTSFVEVSEISPISE